MPPTAPFGSWKSPITADLIVSESVGLIELALDGDDVYWIEMRPREGGRYVIVRRSAEGVPADLLPPPFSARTRVHEYGGGALSVRDGVVFFTNFSDQRLYRMTPGETPVAITPEGPRRYADGTFGPDPNLMIWIYEHHAEEDPASESSEPENAIAHVATDGKGVSITIGGRKFYSNPRVSPDGRWLCYLAWDHPNMPWDGCELWREDLEHGTRTLVAGGEHESIFQPEWSPSGELYFVSDRTGWWNLYCWRNETVVPVCEMNAEWGRPQWVFGIRTYAFAPPTQIVATYSSTLALLDLMTGELEPLELPYTSFNAVHCANGKALFIAASPTEPASLVQLDLATRAWTVLRRSNAVQLDPCYVSVAQPIEFPTEHERTAHAYYYPPTNPDFNAPPEELPPLIVRSHGGPTSAATEALTLDTQYWTSRGIAVVDVNYGGSTGYGRPYRLRLNGQWGVVEVDDCVNAARWLVAQGKADPHRLIIRGGSAGGYTTLAALTFRDVFRAGSSHFGISDLEAMARETHKFESHYLDTLLAPYPAHRDLYRERSPIHFVDRIDCPMILLQGLEDKVVPPNQAELMVAALRRKGLPVAYVPFEGEQHGFRQAKNIKRALEAELYFFGRVLGFAPADAVEPVKIENLH